MESSPPRIRSFFTGAAALAALAISSGCASHIKYLCHKGTATTTVVNVRTDPPDALLELSNGRKTRTPAQLVLRSVDEVSLTISKEGYQPVEVHLHSQFDPWFLGNILMLPPIGFLIDVEHQATRVISPSDIDVVLEPVMKT
jgi:hypothetical protein